MFKSLIRLTPAPSVQPRWGEWLRLRDERPEVDAGGTVSWMDGAPLRLSFGAVYAIVTILIAISGCAGTFSDAAPTITSERRGLFLLLLDGICRTRHAPGIVFFLGLGNPLERGLVGLLVHLRFLLVGFGVVAAMPLAAHLRLRRQSQ
jgi:hypothetical protein